MVVGLEGVDELVLSEVPDADLAFLPCGNDELVLRGVDKTRSSSLVAGESLGAGPFARHEGVPERDVLVVMAVAGRGEQAGATALEYEVRCVLAVALKIEEWM